MKPFVELFRNQPYLQHNDDLQSQVDLISFVTLLISSILFKADNSQQTKCQTDQMFINLPHDLLIKCRVQMENPPKEPPELVLPAPWSAGLIMKYSSILYWWGSLPSIQTPSPQCNAIHSILQYFMENGKYCPSCIVFYSMVQYQWETV